MSLVDALQFKVGLDMRPAERALIEFRSRAEMIGRTLGGMKAAAVGIGGTIAAGFTAGAVAIKSALDAGAEMEAFESRLTTLMGSAGEARARMGELFDFASTTPFEVGPIVAAETTLRGFGAAAEELMPGLIDFAAVTGTDLSQAAIDFGKAWNQGATGLESDGGKILRKQIEIRTGMDATKMSIEDFRAAMMETLDEGMFAGGADRLSKTFSGMVSNLQDEWGRFKLEVADAGLFNNVKGALATTLELIGQNRDSTKLWAGIVGDVLWVGLKGVAYTVAAIADATEPVIAGFLRAGQVAGEFVSFTADALAGINRRLAEVAEMVGAGGVAEGYRVAALGLEDMADKAGKFADASGEAAGTMFANTSTWVGEVGAFFDEAERKAGEYGAAIDELGRKMGEVAPAGGGAGGSAFDKDLTARMEAALDFYDEMSLLGQTDLQREQALYGERLNLLMSYYDDSLLTGEAFNEARKAIDADYERYLNGLREESAAKDVARRQEYATEIVAGTQGLLSALQGMYANSNDETKAAYKAFAIGQIAISTAMGIQRAFADWGWPGGLVPAALTTASAAVQTAAVLSAHQGRSGDAVVYAHQGGMARGPAPDEVDIRALKQESILNSQATRALGQQGVDALNAGRTPAAYVTLNIGRTQQREIFRDEMRSNGAFMRALYQGDSGAGFSGGKAF